MQREPLSYKVLLRSVLDRRDQNELDEVYGEEHVSDLVKICWDKGYVEANELITHDHPKPRYRYTFITELGKAKLRSLEAG